ncbi:MAG: hypothetical protein N0C81_10055 [Candidatus Thiodiazotropha lotti]|nr:hypothetical protein [Candidatus Thiodiazotropha lotti]MCW4195561.1 hypothetical protein [Candidatus Thiodiazotropha lotti]
MNPHEGEVIVFDNLVRPTDVAGQLAQVSALIPESFAHRNAAGKTREVDDIEELKLCASNSGARLKEAFSQK